MTDKARKPPTQPTPPAKAIERWDDEGGAPTSGDRSRKKRPRDTKPKKDSPTSNRSN